MTDETIETTDTKDAAESGVLISTPEPVVEKLACPSVDETWIERIADRVSMLLGRKSDPLASSFKVNNQYWVATYSNNFKDRDDEIFPAKAIDQYIARVDVQLVPLPELWVWHGGKSSRVGQAGVIARQGHFVLAAGTWDDTPQGQTARKFYARHEKDTALSHGFTYNQRTFDGTHYTDFNTFEISLLPRGKEANVYTSIEGVKEMKITDEKKKYFALALGEEGLKKYLAGNEERGKDYEALEIEYKDFGRLDETATDEVDGDKAVAELVTELAEQQGETVKATTATLKAVKALKADLADEKAAREKLEKEWADFRETFDMRGRSASTDDASEMTVEKMAAIVNNVKQQDAPTGKSFFGWPATAEES